MSHEEDSRPGSSSVRVLAWVLRYTKGETLSCKDTVIIGRFESAPLGRLFASKHAAEADVREVKSRATMTHYRLDIIKELRQMKKAGVSVPAVALEIAAWDKDIDEDSGMPVSEAADFVLMLSLRTGAAEKADKEKHEETFADLRRLLVEANSVAHELAQEGILDRKWVNMINNVRIHSERASEAWVKGWE
jgi:hypothetical protein